MECEVGSEQFIEFLNSVLNREGDINKIILYLNEQILLNTENPDKLDAYKECVHLLHKWICYQEIEEIKKFTNIHLGSIQQRAKIKNEKRDSN